VRSGGCGRVTVAFGGLAAGEPNGVANRLGEPYTDTNIDSR
jgi:hypothetical protein